MGGTPCLRLSHGHDPFTRVCHPLSAFFSNSCALFCAFLHSRKCQLFCFQAIPHSAPKKHGDGEGSNLVTNPHPTRRALGRLCVNSYSFFRHSTFKTQPSTFPPVTSHESPVTNRCIIPRREHPPERSR